MNQSSVRRRHFVSLLVASAAAMTMHGAASAEASHAAKAAASNASSNPRWPTAAVSDPTKLGFTRQGLQALDARMKEAVDKGEIAGISYALVKDGQVADMKFVGHQSLQGPPIDADTLFRIRSIGKTITAVAMMQLWEQGKWKPEDPITKFLPELANLKVAPAADNLDNLVPATRVPTMNELMTHTGGFGYGLVLNHPVERAFVERDVGHSKNSAELVKAVSGIPLRAQPGTAWNYSISVDLQGAIVERLSGMSLGEYFRKNIFKPLDMNRTAFWLTEKDRAHLAVVYTRDPATGALIPLADQGNVAADRPFEKGSSFESGGGGPIGLISTLHDYVRFTQMLLNHGELSGHRILKPETVTFMTQNHIGDLKGVIGGDRYGFGYGGRVAREGAPQPLGAFSHYSIEGAWYWIDPATQIAFVGMIQRRGPGGPGSVALGGDGDAPRLVYKALVH